MRGRPRSVPEAPAAESEEGPAPEPQEAAEEAQEAPEEAHGASGDDIAQSLWESWKTDRIVPEFDELELLNSILTFGV